jgi:hypothetical protein
MKGFLVATTLECSLSLNHQGIYRGLLDFIAELHLEPVCQ